MQQKEKSVLLNEIYEFLPALGSLAFFSFVLALMYLVPSIYMNQLFERVFQSRSLDTLLFLAIIVLFLCAMWTAIEVIRARALQRISVALNERISTRVFDALNRQTDALSAAQRGAVMQDLQTVREFIGGAMVTQLLDLLWVPVILAAAYLYHPVIGLTLTLLTISVVVLAVANQLVVGENTKRALTSNVRANEFGRAVVNSAEAVRVMGMLPALVSEWHQRQQAALGWNDEAARRSSLIANLIRFSRHVYLPIMLTIGTLLYLNETVGAGIIFAASVLTSRAVYPVDSISSNWKQFWNLRVSSARIDVMLRESDRAIRKVGLPSPKGSFIASRVAAGPRNRDNLILNDVSFSLESGQALGVVGSSGSGKSSLARVLVGAWPVKKGSISFGGHDLAHWDQDQLGRHIGYVPQDVELLPGTIADNIARFESASEDRDCRLLEATRVAGVQDIVQRLPDGLNTNLGPEGHVLSGGQRQRIALARAVYGGPALLVLDEPNSNLDSAGEESLGRAIDLMRERGSIVVIVTHRVNILSHCDQVLVMNLGTVQAVGRREHILNRLSHLLPANRPSAAVTLASA